MASIENFKFLSKAMFAANVIFLMCVGEVHSAVGRTPGTLTISNGGAATYQIPIFTPPGPRGLQPSVSLVYSSGAGVGYLGKGWGLSGLSIITRCHRTVGQDGVGYAPLTNELTDGYCIDGQRLRKTGGTYGWDASTYGTEVADFSRITAHGTSVTNIGAWGGPDFWTVERKDGTTLTYGATSSSCILMFPLQDVCRYWYLNEIRDRAGNKVSFTYKAKDGNTTGLSHPTRIEWAQTSAGSGSFLYAIDFNYSSNGNAPASRIDAYADGEPKRDTDLLTSIEVKSSGATVRKYLLAYGDSPATGAKRLGTVTECSDASASDCLSPTTITYQNGVAGVGSASFTSATAVTAPNGRFDYNGDGCRDLTYRRSGQWQVRISDCSGGYGSEISTGVGDFDLMVGDPFGNGRDALFGLNGTTYWHVFSWNGSGFTAANTGHFYGPSSGAIALFDMDADGRDDMVFYNGGIGVYHSTSTGSTPTFSGWTHEAFYPQIWYPGWYAYDTSAVRVRPRGSDQWTLDDFDDDGDARPIMIVEGNVTWCVDDPYWYCADAYFSGAVNYGGYGVINGGPLGRATFNSDSCPDLQQSGLVTFSDCAGGGAGQALAGAASGTFDWDGDGRHDILVYISGGYLSVQRSTGVALAAPESTGIPVGCSVFVTDSDGDSLSDLGCHYSDGSLSVHLHNGAGQPPDLATSFSDGFGVTHAITYGVSTQVGYAPYNSATYPQQDIRKPRILVRVVTSSDGAGGTYSRTYSYYGATRDLRRRASLGFDKIETVDSRDGTLHVRKYKREFPLTGVPAEELLYQPGGVTLISSLAITSTFQTLDATLNNERYFPYVSVSSTDTYEVGGAKNGQLIQSVVAAKTYDSSGNQTASTRTVTDKDSGSLYYNQTWTTSSTATFYPNTTYWCLGLPEATSVTSATSVLGESSVSRNQSMTVDYVNCRHTAVDIEPSSSTRRVQTSYGFDGFGNVNSVSVTGRNPNGSSMSARTSGISWGTTGQFPVAETNGLSQATSRTFHSTFGSLVTETDPNSIVVANNEYDSFGRITRSIRADGTATRTTYAACATYGCENGDPGSGATGINRTIILSSEQDTSDTTYRGSSTYLDQFDRPIVRYERSLAGGLSRVGTQYDSFGRTYRQTAPCNYGSCTAYWVTNTYDLLGRVSAQSRPQSQSVSTPVTTTFGYAGRTQTVTDPQSKVTTKILDVNGWMRRSEDHNGYYQLFSYDGAGSLKQVTDSLSNTLFSATYSYGIQAFQDTTNDMDLGSWAYDHNSLGERVYWTDAKSNQFSQTFDALSRVTSRTEAEGTTYFVWGTSSGAHNIGQLDYVWMPAYVEEYIYDSVGRLATRRVSTDQQYSIDYAYTNQGLLDTVTYPTSTSSTRVKVKYGYDYGILKTVTDWTSGSAGTVYWTANAQNARGQTTQETLGNGVVTNRSFDAVTGWLNSIQSGPSGGASLQNHSYLYDLVGNVTQRQENTLGLTENFYYDNLYRLDYSQLNSSTNLDLTYDAMGNITARSDVNGGATWTYHGTKKHAVATTGSGGVSYSYDNNGNMTSRAGSTITWSSYNYPTNLATSTESAAFYYGPDRQYYRQEYSGPSGSESTYYVGGILEKVTNGSGTDWRHYIQAEGQVVAIVSRHSSAGNAVYYPLEDNQGSGSHLTSSGGSSLVRQSYNAFGLPRDGADWDGVVPGGDQAAINGISRRGYTGHSMLGAMGLIHMNGRVQDAITGRFLSPDPYVQNPGFTQNYNRYSYVNNSPLNFIDPSGFSCEVGGDGVAHYGSVDTLAELCEAVVTGRRRLTADDGPLRIWLCAIFGFGCGPDDGIDPQSDLGDRNQSSGGSSTGGGITLAAAVVNTTANSSPQRKTYGNCWNGQQGNWTDFVGGMARQIGNDLANLGSMLRDMNPVGFIAGTLAGDDSDPFGFNNTNLGILGSDLAPVAETVIPFAGRVGYAYEVGRIPGLTGIADEAVAMRNALKIKYRLGLFRNWRMGSADAFRGEGYSDAQIIAKAGRANKGVTAGTGSPSANAILSGGCQ